MVDVFGDVEAASRCVIGRRIADETESVGDTFRSILSPMSQRAVEQATIVPFCLKVY